MSQFAFQRTGDADYPRYLKVLLQGPPKSGKTTFITTAPNVVIASVEAGLMSIAHLDVPFVNIDSTDKLQQLEMILRDDTLRAQAARTLGIEKIETVAIDTLDAWQEMLKKEILVENKRTQMQQADWGTLKERMSAILKKFVTLPVNVIFTVHTSTTQDDEQRMVYAPALQGGIKDEIAGYVDFSLLSFRQRETGLDGTPKINYYLKCEGDLKNPHLGNRAAGRVPEITSPDFGVLHTAVFSAVKPLQRSAAAARPAEETSPSPLAILEVPAQSSSQPEPTRAAVELPPAPPPSGTPDSSDPEGPITASGISMLTKSYTEQGLLVPEDLKTWTLGKGHKIARYFMAWKSDKTAGKNPTRDDLVGYLEACEAFNGEMTGVQTGVENLKPSAKSKSEEKRIAALKEEPAQEPVPEADPEPEAKSEDELAEEQAIGVLKDTLGAVEIGYQVTAGEACDVCGEPVDDTDIATLGLQRFKKKVCVKDYKQLVADARK